MELTNFKSNRYMKLFFLTRTEEGFLVEGLVREIYDQPYRVVFRTQDGAEFEAKKLHMDLKEEARTKQQCKDERWFSVFIAWDGKRTLKLKAYLLLDGQETLLKPVYKIFFPVSDVLAESYGHVQDMLLRVKGKALVILPFTREKQRSLEKEYQKALRKSGESEMLRLRKQYFWKKRWQKKDIWLILDRNSKADDNGEHLFRYLNEQKDKDRQLKDKDFYFVIEKGCPDYERMRGYGKVVELYSARHKLLFLLSDYVISSQFNPYVFKPFGEKAPFVQDLFSYRSVFLQHGVTQNDLSRFISRKTKDFYLVAAVSEAERQAFLQEEYGYRAKDVQVLGFARFDHLKKHEREDQKRILIMPSWRKSLTESYDQTTGESVYWDGFKETPYYQFYNALLSDERLLSVMRKKGYKGAFALHPAHYKQCVDFVQNDCFTVLDEKLDYQEQFIAASLLVTDYSSVAFDVAYMKKPVIYARFDEAYFYESQKYGHGYFDYEKDGFGPVCYDLETTIQSMIACIEADCMMAEQYENRVDTFFAHTDDKNCERITQALLQADGN